MRHENYPEGGKEPCDPQISLSDDITDGPITVEHFISRTVRRLNRFNTYYRYGNDATPVHFPQVLTEARWEEELHKFLDLEFSRGE